MHTCGGVVDDYTITLNRWKNLTTKLKTEQE